MTLNEILDPQEVEHLKPLQGGKKSPPKRPKSKGQIPGGISKHPSTDEIDILMLEYVCLEELLKQSLVPATVETKLREGEKSLKNHKQTARGRAIVHRHGISQSHKHLIVTAPEHGKAADHKHRKGENHRHSLKLVHQHR